MIVAEIISNIRIELVKLRELDLGYPLGNNSVGAPLEPSLVTAAIGMKPGSRWLVPLYTACDGISLPDIHIGYFVNPSSRISAPIDQFDPVMVQCDSPYRIISFGTSGGGDHLVLAGDDGRVHLLRPSKINDGKYDGNNGRIETVAEGIDQFLHRILTDITAFVYDYPHHKYLA